MRWIASSGAQTADELLQALIFVRGVLSGRTRDQFATVRRNLELMDLDREVFAEAEIDQVRDVLCLTKLAAAPYPDNDYLSGVER